MCLSFLWTINKANIFLCLIEYELNADECVLASSGPCNKADIFLGLIEYELNSLLGASHLLDYMSVHSRFDLEGHLLNIVVGLDEYLLNSILMRTLLMAPSETCAPKPIALSRDFY